MQEIAWLLWGACAAGHAGLAGAEELAARLFAVIERDYAEPGTSLPRHSSRSYRSGVVSFGEVVYYLRALHE